MSWNRPISADQQIERMTRAKHHKCATVLVVHTAKLSHVQYIAALCKDAFMWAPGSVGK